jgi:hypothetical protein
MHKSTTFSDLDWKVDYQGLSLGSFAITDRLLGESDLEPWLWFPL